MNEVRPTHVTPAISPVASAASSTVTEAKDSTAISGKELPVDNIHFAEEAKETQSIEQAVTEINDYVQSVQRDLHFSVDEDSGETIIRVRDKESGELIRQIPEDIFLSLAQNLKDNQPIHLFDAHG